MASPRSARTSESLPERVGMLTRCRMEEGEEEDEAGCGNTPRRREVPPRVSCSHKLERCFYYAVFLFLAGTLLLSSSILSEGIESALKTCTEDSLFLRAYGNFDLDPHTSTIAQHVNARSDALRECTDLKRSHEWRERELKRRIDLIEKTHPPVSDLSNEKEYPVYEEETGNEIEDMEHRDTGKT